MALARSAVGAALALGAAASVADTDADDMPRERALPGVAVAWFVPGGSRSVIDTHWQSPAVGSGPLTLRAGFGWRATDAVPERWSLDGTAIEWSFGRSRAYASVERRHWGPGWMGSLILDGAAPALPAVGWRRDEARSDGWAAALGPWSADVFAAQLRGHTEPRRPFLIGMRVQWRPIGPLAIGASRMLQWGGVGRPQGLGNLLRALAGRDNIDGTDKSQEPGNQLAGVDWRWAPTGDDGAAFYGQLVGEDEAGLWPSKNMLLAGVDATLPLTGAEVRVFAEAVDTMAGRVGANAAPGTSYRHPLYPQDYTSQGALLGHPAGGDVRLATVGTAIMQGRRTGMVALSAGSAAATAQRFAPGRIYGLNAAGHIDLPAQQRLAAGWWWWRDAQGARGEARVWWQYAAR
jgi:hypothetical protein